MDLVHCCQIFLVFMLSVIFLLIAQLIAMLLFPASIVQHRTRLRKKNLFFICSSVRQNINLKNVVVSFKNVFYAINCYLDKMLCSQNSFMKCVTNFHRNKLCRISENGENFVFSCGYVIRFQFPFVHSSNDYFFLHFGSLIYHQQVFFFSFKYIYIFFFFFRQKCILIKLTKYQRAQAQPCTRDKVINNRERNDIKSNIFFRGGKVISDTLLKPN